MGSDLNRSSDINSIEARLDDFAASVMEQKINDFGYPLNQKSKLVGFYKWLYGSGLNLSILDNAGDPFDSKDTIPNTLEFEREVIEYFGPLYGFEPGDLWGLVTFSGTDGNDHGLYFGSKYLEKKTGERPVMYVSDAAHYSSRRLADLQNLELALIPSDVHGCMIPEEFEKALVPERPALIVFAMGTTFKGGIDDIGAVNAILSKYPSMNIYRHVDAALFGGYIPHTKFRDILDRRINPFESIAISGHKFFGMDEPAGLFMTTTDVRNNQERFDITYLNRDMPMINCSRSAISPLKLWWIIKHTSKEEFAEQSEAMLERALWLKDELESIGYPVWLEPASNTIYFKRPPEDIVTKYDLAPDYDERLGGELSHIVIMQHVTRERLEGFLKDIKEAVS